MKRDRPGNHIPTDTPPTSWRARWWLVIGVLCVILMGSAL